MKELSKDEIISIYKEELVKKNKLIEDLQRENKLLLDLTMKNAKKRLEEVPSTFRKAAVSNTEDYARQHAHKRITLAVFEAFRKELGM